MTANEQMNEINEYLSVHQEVQADKNNLIEKALIEYKFLWKIHVEHFNTMRILINEACS